MDADPHNETSINPAIRRSLAIFGVTGGIANQDMSREEFVEAMEYAESLIQPLRDLTPNSGVYREESSMNEPNWEYANYGENYAALKEIKFKYDPHRMFRVWNGIGGTRPETGTEHQDEI